MNEFLPSRSSFAEDIIADAVREVFPHLTLKRNAKPDWLMSDKGRPLELDIFLPELRLAIEIQGPQHFKQMFGSKKQHLNQLANDSRKKQECVRHGIHLLWMDYEGIFKNFRTADKFSRTRLLKRILLEFEKSHKQFMFWKDAEVHTFE